VEDSTHQYVSPMHMHSAWRALSKARISGIVGTGAGFGAATGMARATEAKRARMAMNFMVACWLGWVVRDTSDHFVLEDGF
jgi:ABC-type spermidine/putrescine transport system permease subunit I